MSKHHWLVLALCSFFVDATYSQSLWINSDKRTGNGSLVFQTEDDLHFFFARSQEWTGDFTKSNFSIRYFIRNDSVFMKALEKADLYALSTNPETLPDSLKGPFFLGKYQGDSITLKLKASERYPTVLKRPTPTKLAAATEKQLSALLTKFSLLVDDNFPSSKKGSSYDTVSFPKKPKPSYSGDPFPEVFGVYRIFDYYFLYHRDMGRKIFQVIEVDENGVVIESLCPERRRTYLKKTKRPLREETFRR